MCTVGVVSDIECFISCLVIALVMLLKKLFCGVIVLLFVLALTYYTTHPTFNPKVKLEIVTNRDINNATGYLPSYVTNNLKRFVFFVGYARSGHSIIASMLDAHPNVIISHEYSLFSKWIEDPELHSKKSWLFNTLYKNSHYHSVKGLRNRNATKKGYSLSIPGWWQGKYRKEIHAIGDKAGGMTAKVYRKNHELFTSTYRQLQKTLGNVPISVIHVLRNPYDNIATMLLYNHHIEKNATTKYVNDDGLTKQITSYFKQVRGVVDMIRKVPLDAIEVHNADIISNPKKEFRKICSHLHIDCGEDYLQMCAETMYLSESMSRNLVSWSDHNVQLVAMHIQNFNSLLRYHF